MTQIEYMKAMRTQSQAEVDHRMAQHDSEDLRPEERAAYDTGSMHRLEMR